MNMPFVPPSLSPGARPGPSPQVPDTTAGQDPGLSPTIVRNPVGSNDRWIDRGRGNAYKCDDPGKNRFTGAGGAAARRRIPGPEWGYFRGQVFRSAWSRSSRMSSMFSRPTDSRMKSSVTPWPAAPPGQLLVGRRRRVDHQALGVSDVGQQRKELQIVDELLPGLHPSLDAEAQDGPVQSAVMVLLRQPVGRVAGKAG